MVPPRHYDQIVSLGRGCQPAHQIRRLYADAQAHVFDWIVTPDAGLLHSITTDLDGFFARERLEMGPEDCIVDRVTDARFLHEFPSGQDFGSQYDKHAGRYEMLAERWRQLLASQQKVLFVRQHAWDSDLRGTAIRLRDTIALKAPHLCFDLLYLSATHDEDWREERIVNVFLRQPEPYVWTGDDAAWEQVLAQAFARSDR
ncbi:MAG: DUF1796 family putative cysteine peptidase [Alphaproteobacteria bacterium]|nr:DUF1796 family putative cysteine peptidase [Alphaproteobacteria bacterium]